MKGPTEGGRIAFASAWDALGEAASLGRPKRNGAVNASSVGNQFANHGCRRVEELELVLRPSALRYRRPERGGKLVLMSRMTSCRTCGGMIAETASARPRRGTIFLKPRSSVVAVGLIAMLVIAILYVLSQRYWRPQSSPKRRPRVRLAVSSGTTKRPATEVSRETATRPILVCGRLHSDGGFRGRALASTRRGRMALLGLRWTFGRTRSSGCYGLACRIPR